ncbi:MAG: restriction endonuclease subunit S [Sphingobacteriales bacterium]|nr:MAG: restriction endonuclease subunit S [Sphingobacteriales bacterium]
MSNTNAHKPGYKQTPIGWIPEEWEVKELKMLGAFSKGRGISKEELVDIGIPCIRYGEIYTTHDYVIKEFKSFINEDTAIESKRINKGDILFAGSGETIEEIGKCVAYNFDDEAYAGGDIIVLTVNRDIDAVYLAYTLEIDGVNRQKRILGQGNSVVHIYSRDLAKILVPLATKAERNKIAVILSTWDEAIQKTQQLIAQLKKRNKGLTQKLLTPKPYWKEKKLSQIFERVSRRNTTGNTNVVTISAQRGFVRQNDFFSKIVASDTLDNYFLVRNGEYCYNKSYSKGYDWGATKRLNDFAEAVVTTLYICFALKDIEHNSGDFFEYFFDANSLDKGLSKIAHEGGRAHGLLNVTPSDFFSLNLQVPDLNEQNRIYKILSIAKTELTALEQKLSALQQQKKGLMQKLLMGEVRVKVKMNQYENTNVRRSS